MPDVSPDADGGAGPGEYDAEIAAAVKEHRLGHFEEARAHFLIAHRLQPSARTLRGLGKVEYELRNYGEALRYFRACLNSQVKPVDASMRAEVERLVARASVYTGEVHLEIMPDSATISVDGILVARGPRASLSLDIGEHLLEFQADGRLSERRAVHVRSGEATEMHVVLATPNELNLAASTSERRDDGLDRRRRRWWIAVAVAAAAGAVATGLAVGLRREPRTVAAAPPASPNAPRAPMSAALEWR